MPTKKDKEIKVKKTIEEKQPIKGDTPGNLDLAVKAIIKKYGTVINSLENHGDMDIPTSVPDV